MSTLKILQLDEKAVLISIMKTKIGKEFEIAERISKRFEEHNEAVKYFTGYGQYDLFEMRMVDSFESVYNVPFDQDIIGFASSLFFSWKEASVDVIEWASGFPIILVVFLSIMPYTQVSHSFDIERRIINRITEEYSDDVNLYAAMGRDEILLLLRGNSLEKLLPMVSYLRRDLPSSLYSTSEKESVKKDLQAIVNTTTFPIISHPNLKNEYDYNQLEGLVYPIVNIVCDPGYEQLVFNEKPESCEETYETYGFNDLVLTWKTPIELSQFTKEFTQFRQKLSIYEGISSTETSFLELPQKVPAEELKKVKSNKTQLPPKTIPNIEVILEKENMLEPLMKARLTEFLEHLNSFYQRKDSDSSIKDMLGVVNILATYLESLENTTELSDKFIIDTSISEVIDIGNNGLNQRHVGLESHTISIRQLPFPSLRGINGNILSASCIPYYIFSKIFPDTPVQETWGGYVVFGLSYSYQLLRGRVLSLPANTLNRPIEDWWGITHEISHAIYWASEFYKTDLPEDIKQYLSDLDIGATEHSYLTLDIQEIYANWFDFKYIFKGNIQRYFTAIWRSWLRWERTREFKEEYLLRSLAIYVTSDLKSVDKARNDGYPEAIEFLIRKYHEMISLIEKNVSGFEAFVSSVRDPEIVVIAKLVEKLNMYLHFLENEYFDQETYDNLNPPYDEALLYKHIQDLEEGLIVLDNVPNPIELLHTLYDRYVSSDKKPSLRTTASTILTLWHKFIEDYGNEI
jgi:hypothetical protein